MKYWIRAAVIFLALGSNGVGAEDLFPSGTARKVAQFSALPAGTTIGGYPLYTGGLTWYLLGHETADTNLDVRILSASMRSLKDGDFFADMYVTASSSGATGDGYFTADLCSLGKSHLYMHNKSAGKNDNCMFIDPHVVKMQTGEATLLFIKIRNSQSSARLYDLSILVNPDKLGFLATTVADWSSSAIAGDSKKQQAVDKLVVWAKLLQDGVNKAIAFSRPQDAFSGVPDMQTLSVTTE